MFQPEVINNGNVYVVNPWSRKALVRDDNRGCYVYPKLYNVTVENLCKKIPSINIFDVVYRH